MAQTPQELRDRTKAMAIRIVRLFRALPSAKEAQIMGTQLLRCGTSVAANYRAACRGRSVVDVVAKLGIVEEEADECIYWIELLGDSGVIPRDRLATLKKEANEIVAMTVASIKTMRSRRGEGLTRFAGVADKAFSRLH